MSDGIVPLTPIEVAQQEAKAAHEGYVKRVLIALDEDLNVDTGGLPDETISSRAARSAENHQVVGEFVSKFLDIFQKNHGAKAQAGDLERAIEVEAAEKNSGGLE